MTGSLVVLTGASGSGKTTLAKTIQERYPKECEVMFFDSVGVLSSEEMKKWGGQDPGATWQRGDNSGVVCKIGANSQSRKIRVI
jgi:ABC-type glutathione transport system ATPase component